MQKEVKVEGMSCGHCKMNIEQSLSNITGVRSAEVNLQAKSLNVSFDESVINFDTIIETVEELGFDVVK